MSQFKRNSLSEKDAKATVGLLQQNLTTMIDFALQLKQAHWNVDFIKVPATVTAVADRLSTTVNGLRESIAKLGELDPISEDMLIGISGTLEKHLWMVQSQEL